MDTHNNIMPHIGDVERRARLWWSRNRCVSTCFRNAAVFVCWYALLFECKMMSISCLIYGPIFVNYCSSFFFFFWVWLHVARFWPAKKRWPDLATLWRHFGRSHTSGMKNGQLWLHFGDTKSSVERAYAFWYIWDRGVYVMTNHKWNNDEQQPQQHQNTTTTTHRSWWIETRGSFARCAQQHNTTYMTLWGVCLECGTALIFFILGRGT